MEVQLKKIITLGLIMASFSSFSSTKISKTHFGSLDINKLHTGDLLNEKLGNAPRFAVEHKVAINFMTKQFEKSGDNYIIKHRVNADNAV